MIPFEGGPPCGRQAAVKISEEIEDGEIRHPYTQYVCEYHFRLIMGLVPPGE